MALQRKVDELFVELANYESEKANLEVAQQTGMTRRGAGARRTKLQGLIRGAKLRLSNAEKRLKDTLQSSQQSLPDTSDSHRLQQMVDNQQIQSQGAEVSELRPMFVDNTTINPPTITQDTIGEGTDLPANLSSAIADSAGLLVFAADPLTVPIGTGPSLSPETSKTSPHNPAPSAEAIGAVGTGLATVSEPKAVQTFEAAPSPGVSDQHPTTFKRIDRSESENEEDGLSVKDIDMNLITIEDKAELQQQMFERRFIMVPRPRKRTKYVEVSGDSDSTGDPNIFDDDDGETGPTEKTGLAKPGNTNPTFIAQPKPLPRANNGQGSNEDTTVAISKGKGREDDTGGGKRKAAATSKGKGSKKDSKDKGGIEESEKIDADMKAQEDYHPSDHSVAKAACVDSVLMGQRSRLADPETHRLFAEKWLNARSPAERPEFPSGIELIRYDPEYLPDVATANYHLALQLMLNHSNNYLCIPHVKLNRRLVSPVDNLEGPIQILGTPLPRKQNPNTKTSISRPFNHFHCGCHEKVALAGFVMWKTWKAKTWINDQLVVEGLYKDKAFHPREVLFILQFLKSKFGFTVEDMFTGSFDEEEESRKEAQVMKKVANFCARRHYELIGQKMTLDEYFPVLEEELKPEWI